MANVNKAIHEACRRSIHRDPSGAGSIPGLLARIVALEAQAGVKAPELDDAQAIHAQWEAEEKAKAESK